MASVSYNLGLRFGGENAQLEELIVSEAARGRNVGSALVEAAVDEARRHGCHEIGLYAVERNRPFYEKHGFRYAGPELRRSLTGKLA
jgi:GNAT superfamily N-acetyltransferase